MIADYMEPITGYRAWNVHHNGLLIGQNHAEPWPPYTPFVARCGHAVSLGHIVNGLWVQAPVWSCYCGVYAFHTQESVDERVMMGRSPWMTGVQDIGMEAMVWGEVKLWGKVIVHEDGYRAEFAYPGELWCEDESLCPKVASLYGVICRFKAIDRGKRYDDFLPPIRYTFWRNKQISKSSASSPAVAPQLHQPSLAQIKVIGATPWQQQQAQMQAKQIPMLTQDWRDMWLNGFKRKKPQMTQMGCSTPGTALFQPNPAQVAFLSRP